MGYSEASLYLSVFLNQKKKQQFNQLMKSIAVQKDQLIVPSDGLAEKNSFVNA